ncbi:MAG TPA: septum formation initiator family protein [Mobilitalea sp.]|nr:septum formation initiator family protein [Mobilitalea sp.]
MRRRKKNGTGVGIIVFVVLILFAIVSYNRIGLKERYDEAQIKIDRLQAKIDEQEDRALDISNLKAYVQTKSYIEEVARDKLGLVYKDEYIFKRQE